MSKSKKVTVRSLQELNLRYVRFCAKHDLDDTVQPEDQYAETNIQQVWLDKHIEQITQAKAEGVLLARGRIDAVRDIAKDLHDRFEINTSIKFKKSAQSIKNKIGQAIAVAVDYQPSIKRTIELCPNPFAMQNAKTFKTGQTQLGLPIDLPVEFA